MGLDDHVLEDLKAQKEACHFAGCHEEIVKLLKKDLEEDRKEVMSCIEKIKNTMQTKSHFVWEIAKVIAIPLLTVAFMWWGLFKGMEARVQSLDDLVKKLDVLVLELIKDRR